MSFQSLNNDFINSKMKEGSGFILEHLGFEIKFLKILYHNTAFHSLSEVKYTMQ